jgi:hypothetical protein
MSSRRPETVAELDALAERLSNWGRWGADDQAGTLNHITPSLCGQRQGRCGRDTSSNSGSRSTSDPAPTGVMTCGGGPRPCCDNLTGLPLASEQ